MFYDALNAEFSFDHDPCPLFGTEGLDGDWGSRNFVNPPYSRMLKAAFVRKAIEQSKKGKLCVMLLPVSTSTALFHDYIQPNAREIRFLRGRVIFASPHGIFSGRPQHDSMVVVFGGK